MKKLEMKSKNKTKLGFMIFVIFFVNCVGDFSLIPYSQATSMINDSEDILDGMNFYYGNIHSHTIYSDGFGMGTPANALIWARDVARYDFYAITDHSGLISNREWKDTGIQIDNFNEDGKFVAIRGFEWTHKDEGHVNVFTTSSYIKSKPGWTELFTGSTDPNLDGLYTWVKNNNGLAHFNHPGVLSNTIFNNMELNEDLVDNFFGIETGCNKWGNNQGRFLQYYQEALDNGWKVAPINNQDNHFRWLINKHMTVAIAPELTRDNIFNAYKNRRVYSTDDPNIKIVFKINNEWMGSEISTTSSTSKCLIYITDDEPIQSVEIISNNGAIIASKAVNQKILLWEPVIETSENSFFYLKVRSTDLLDNEKDYNFQLALTAPIWINSSNPYNTNLD